MEEKYEALSMLLAGDLDPASEAAVRQRIATDAAWRDAWEAMQSVPGALASLRHPAPPPALDERVLASWSPAREAVPAPAQSARPTPLPGGGARWQWGFAAVAAAVAVVAVGFETDGPPVVQVAGGVQRFDGEIAVIAADTRIEIDGRVDVAVEPSPPLARGLVREGTMDLSHVFAAGGGALVTVMVLEGTAVVKTAGDPSILLHAGEKQSIGTVPAMKQRASPVPGEAEADGDTEQALADLRVKYALVKGQLDAIQGAAIDFPGDLPTAFRATGFAPAATAIAAAIPGTELLSTECEEYPCIAYYRTGSPTEGWHDALNAAVETTYGPEVGVFQFGVRLDDDGRSYGIAAVAVTPTDEPEAAAEIRTRVTSRVQPTLSEIEADIKEEVAPR